MAGSFLHEGERLDELQRNGYKIIQDPKRFCFGMDAVLLSRFAVIDIPDYTDEEKKIIFSKYALPKVLKRMSMKENEIILTDEGLDRIIQKHANTSGIRDLEQAAEHIAANALYQIEVNHMQSVTIDAQMVEKVLE